MKSGRISNQEREAILLELGAKVQQIYDEIVESNSLGYNLSVLRGSLKFQPDVASFNNIFWIDTGDEELTKIAYYFEYGTGLYNTRLRTINRDYIRPKNALILKFRKEWNGIMFADKVRGVHPVFMMMKAIKTVDANRSYIQKDIREQFYA